MQLSRLNLLLLVHSAQLSIPQVGLNRQLCWRMKRCAHDVCSQPNVLNNIINMQRIVFFSHIVAIISMKIQIVFINQQTEW